IGAIGSQMGSKNPVVWNTYEEPMDLFNGQIYGGGAARLFTLMGQVGEKKFWAGVKDFLTQYKFKNVTTDDFFAVMGKAAGRDLSTFEKQFFNTAAFPKFVVTRRGSDVVITQPEPAFDLDLKLSFLSRNEIEKEVPVKIHGPQTIVDGKGMEQDLVVLDYPVTAMAT